MSIVAESKIEYNRSSRKWLVWPGDISPDQARIVGSLAVFDSTAEGKRMAMLCALTHEAPEVAAEVEAIIANRPDLASRAVKAGFLAASGHVWPPKAIEEYGSYAGEIARVKSQTDPTIFYAIVQNPHGVWCECADQAGECKHILAVRITSSLAEPMTKCPLCHGSGIESYASVDVPGALVREERCGLCSGRGEISQSLAEEFHWNCQYDSEEPF